MRGDFETRFKARWENRRKKWEDRSDNRRQHDHIWTGAFILLIGVAALVKVTTTGFPPWIFSWQSLLILLGLFIGVKHKFKGSAWFILILIGSAFLLRNFYPDLSIRRYILPAALIALGGYLIVRPRRKHSWDCFDDQKKKSSAADSGITEDKAADENYQPEEEYKEDYVDNTSIFGGAKKNIISKNFKGGDLVNIFGGTELDLTRADFKGTAVIELTTIFGGTKLVLPSNWTVRSEVVTILGGLEDKRNMQNIIDSPEKILLLKGTVIFGGIEITSF